ncbi:MAG: alpha/beta hydrolase fold [Subtercola sp.]|nr:alpha/beta hydrolase fold [Subtercola sp.]
MISELSVPLSHEGSGAGGSVVLVHGLASAGRSWSAFTHQLPVDVSWRAVDLPGHGQSDRLAAYSFGELALAVARVCDGMPAPLTIIGHSLGGAVCLLVGSGLYGVTVSRVVALDSKVTWTRAEAERAAAVAAKPAKVFATRDEALRFWQLVAGVPVGSAIDAELAADVVADVEGGWSLRYDQAAAALGAAPMQKLVGLCPPETQVQLVRGKDDPLVPAGDTALAGALAPITVAESGHSPHVERPAELARALGFGLPPLTETPSKVEYSL